MRAISFLATPHPPTGATHIATKMSMAEAWFET
jgi:hypothetical protein